MSLLLLLLVCAAFFTQIAAVPQRRAGGRRQLRRRARFWPVTLIGGGAWSRLPLDRNSTAAAGVVELQERPDGVLGNQRLECGEVGVDPISAYGHESGFLCAISSTRRQQLRPAVRELVGIAQAV